MIATGKFENTFGNDTISIKQDDKTYTFKSSNSMGDDYWSIQHYKTNNIANVAPQER